MGLEVPAYDDLSYTAGCLGTDIGYGDDYGYRVYYSGTRDFGYRGSRSIGSPRSRAAGT